ncbi:phytanoyl-CoA dioxygenase family protein [Erythrobacter sp. W53]|uniref:phytanoyl-CoA dioxygenase family protein n=1 Tax=Erythrobacteraceae TaxID=335929 RepID=UPI0036D34C29
MDSLDSIREQLEDRGLVKLEGLIEADSARAAYGSVVSLAKEHSLYVDGQWIKSTSRFGSAKPFRNALTKLSKSAGFPKLVGDHLAPMIEQLVGDPVALMAPGQQILFSLPSDQRWSIPSDVWHTDLPKFAERTTPGLQAFTFLDDVEPQGGGTLVVAGSHRLLNKFSSLSSKEVKQHLRREEFFQMLFDSDRPEVTAPQDATGRIGDVELEVVELTGSVGDLYLMDLRVLHTPAPNSSEKARFMPTCRFPTAEVALKLSEKN